MIEGSGQTGIWDGVVVQRDQLQSAPTMARIKVRNVGDETGMQSAQMPGTRIWGWP